MSTKPGTVTFSFSGESPFGYESYPEDCKKYFIELEIYNKYQGTDALMVGEYRDKFRNLASTFPDHPNFEG